MSNDSRFKNLLNNISSKQKIELAIGLILVIILIIGVINIFQSLSFNEDNESADNPTEETYIDDQGYTVVRKTYKGDDGNMFVDETKEDDYGNVTTTNPQLITTYFPYQVMREHINYTPTLKYFLAINEETGVINVNMEDCDVENDKKEIKQYLDSIPLDLSTYTIEYDLMSVDTDCRN